MFFSSAFAQEATAAVAEQPSFIASMIPLFLIMGIFYALILRPQQKRAKAHQAMIMAVKKSDKIITGGGIVGKVVKVDESADVLQVQIAEGVTVEVTKGSITHVYGKDAPTTQDTKPTKKTKSSVKPIANDN
jgi:preprotein translocase subunit YajC